MPKFIKRCALRFLNLVVRRNRWTTFLIFGIKIPDRKRVGWDFTTIALKGCLLRYVTDGSRVLEIGTGSYAILSLYIAKHRKCDITASELLEEYAASSVKTAELNHLKLNIVRSDMYSNIDGIYDLIFWNSVYIPRSTGTALGIDKMADAESDWCGGETGTEEIERFLRESSCHIGSGGKILLGFNPVYLKKALVKELCERNGYAVPATHGALLNPSKVFVLEKEQGRDSAD